MEPHMTDEFICHASSPRQWLEPDDRLPGRNPLYVKLILAVQFHKCNFVGRGGGGGRPLPPHCPGERRSLPPVTIPRLCFYCIVFCIIVLVVKGLGDTAICQVHLAGAKNAKGITADPAGAPPLSNRRGAPCLWRRSAVQRKAGQRCGKNTSLTQRISNSGSFLLFFWFFFARH